MRKWGFAALTMEVTREGVRMASTPDDVETCIVLSFLDMRKRSPVEMEEGGEEEQEGGST